MIVATVDRYALAEGPVWDPLRSRLLWVDILGGCVHEGRLDGDTITPTAAHDFDCMVGSLAVADDGTLLVAAQEELVVVHPDRRREHRATVVSAGQGRRLNDGGVDPHGRFLIGTLALDGGSEQEQLVRLEADGQLTTLDDDLTLSNGLAWSADGSRMYSVDTLRRTVYVREYDQGERRPFLVLEDGYPDGITIDAEDHLWVAVWGAGAVQRHAPDGALVERLAVPAPHTSSLAFAGEDLRTLVVTTARSELDTEQLRAYPDSGRLFTTRTHVAGLPLPAWKKD